MPGKENPVCLEGILTRIATLLHFFKNYASHFEHTFLQLCSSLELSLAPEKELFCSSPILTLKLKIQYAELHCHRIADIYRLSADKNVSVEDLNIQRAKLANLNHISFLKQ